MPRKQIGERSERWETSTKPEVLFPKLSAKHKKMAQLIGFAFDNIDAMYEKVAKILDEYGIFGSNRLMYKAFAQELWKACSKYSSKALIYETEAIAFKYLLYNCDSEILYKIGQLFGLEVFKLIKEFFKQALEEAKTLKAPLVYHDNYDINFEYDSEGNLTKVIITDKITGDKKTITFEYDDEGNVIGEKEE